MEPELSAKPVVTDPPACVEYGITAVLGVTFDGSQIDKLCPSEASDGCDAITFTVREDGR